MAAIDRSVEFEHKEKRSRFCARLIPAASIEEVKAAVDQRRRKMHKARHHSWACRLDTDSGTVFEQARDDGEVGRPGMILLELLRRHKLEGGIVVSRFFGGVKLGPGGVGRAFRTAAEQAIGRLGGS